MNVMVASEYLFLVYDNFVPDYLQQFAFFQSNSHNFTHPRYMAPAPPPYDPYGGYPVPPVPMPAPSPVPAPSSYVPVQVIPQIKDYLSNACFEFFKGYLLK